MLDPDSPLKDLFAEHTEIQLATLEYMRTIRKFSGRDIKRQQTIAGNMVEACWVHKIRLGDKQTRLRNALLERSRKDFE